MSGSIYNGVAGPVSRRAGVLSLEINGEVVEVASEFSYSAVPFKREMLLGLSGPQGFSEMPINCFITGTLRDSLTMSQARVFAMTNVPVVAVLASGKTVYGDTLTCTECSDVKSTEATFDIKFEGFLTESSY